MSKKVKRFGKTPNNKQRFRCLKCLKTFIWQRTYNKIHKEQHWFKLWVTEGYSARQLTKISGHSIAKIYRIIHYWLNQQPPALSQNHYLKAEYVMFDGTYFHKDGCLAIVMDSGHRILLDYWYIDRENYHDVYLRLMQLRQNGLSPKAITIDGHKQVTEAIQNVWPAILVQRCLFHIENQGLMWIRTFPKTEAGKTLRLILKNITGIRSDLDRENFLTTYRQWRNKYDLFIQQLPRNSIANKDLKRTTALINNALPNMFHFIKDQGIASTTNLLENFYSQLKHQYRNHRGLSRNHKIAFLRWFCYFKTSKIATFCD